MNKLNSALRVVMKRLDEVYTVLYIFTLTRKRKLLLLMAALFNIAIVGSCFIDPSGNLLAFVFANFVSYYLYFYWAYPDYNATYKVLLDPALQPKGKRSLAKEIFGAAQRFEKEGHLLRTIR